MPARPQYSIIIPVYNESKRLGPALRQLDTYLSNLPKSWQLIAVDDGSTDGTVTALSRHQDVLPMQIIQLEQNQGKGGAVRAGMLAATGHFRAFIDIDMATPPEELDRLFAALAEGADVAIGSRITRNGVDLRKTGQGSQSPLRQLLGSTFRLIATKPFLGDIKDSQCGAKAFTSSSAEILFPLQQTTRWAFDIELLYIAKKMAMRIDEVPVKWSAKGDSKLRPSLSLAIGVAKELLTIAWVHRGTGIK